MAEGLRVWNGQDQQDLVRLTDAISANCTCTELATVCPAHSMLTDQKMLDRLAFVAATRQTFIDGEQKRR